MLKDFAQTLTEALRERIASPFLRVFSIAWIVINYQTVLVILSFEDILNKLNLIRFLIYPTRMELFTRTILYPALVSLLYISLFPFLEKYVYRIWRYHQSKLVEEKQRHDKMRILTEEEKTRHLQEVSTMIRRSQEEIALRDLQISAHIKRIESLEDQLKKTTAATPEGAGKDTPPTTKLESPSALNVSIPATAPAFTRILLVLRHQENLGEDGVEEIALIKAAELKISEGRIRLQEMESRKLIGHHFPPKGKSYSLTHDGRVLANQIASRHDPDSSLAIPKD